MPPPLPIDPYIDGVRAALTSHRAAVIRAAPGAGKTTRVPPAVCDAGRVVVLQPRRVAARAMARRIAEERGWTLGREVGWHVRFERRFSRDTRVLFVTEGMLTNYLDQDPLLSDAATVVLDEFHERSVHTDVGLALMAEAWRARDDLRLLVMSATMDPVPVQNYLEGCPLIDVPGTVHPLSIEYAAGESAAEALAHVLPRTTGDVLCFLPGAGEIERAIQESRAIRDRLAVDLVPLHGSLDADAQDRALQAGPRRRVVLATNLAETSLTVPGVSVVIDTGLQKVARYDAERAIDTLVLERVTEDAAAQRAGRAARLGPGLVRRLWDGRDRLRPTREPEIHRVDLAGVLLGLMAAGQQPDRFAWFESPLPGRVAAARDLLERLRAVRDGRVTPLGHILRRLPLHPRLARVLVEARGAWEAAAACAVLSERRASPPAHASTSCDLLPLIDRWASVPSHTRQVADSLTGLVRGLLGDDHREHLDERELREALLAGYPDRVARRRTSDPGRVVLASGRGARMGRESGVVDGDWLVALDVTAGRESEAEALVRLASRVEPEWLVPTEETVEHRFDASQQSVKAVAVQRYDALVVRERYVAPDPALRARMLAAAWRERMPDRRTATLLNRARAAGIGLDVVALSELAALSVNRADEIDLASAMSPDMLHRLESQAPAVLRVPSGRTVRLNYNDDGSVSAAVKLQELFGLEETPRIGPRQEPVVFELLAPNGRPVQTTRDLRSFWTRTYPEVRKELRGRYPRHPWPEDPWTAAPTHGTTRRR